jgi:DNA-binding PadR family transcriptional regulator
MSWISKFRALMRRGRLSREIEEERWIVSELGPSENNRRSRFYRITEPGRKQLGVERENWRRTARAVALVLGFGEAAASGVFDVMDSQTSRADETRKAVRGD